MSNLMHRHGPAVRRPHPMEILTAEHDDAVLRGERAKEAKVLDEYERPMGAVRIRPKPSPHCEHPNLSALRSAGSSFDDHATHFGYCATCQDYFVVTEWKNGQIESRPMTEAEQLRFATAEDRAQREEWLEDLQAGDHS